LADWTSHPQRTQFLQSISINRIDLKMIHAAIVDVFSIFEDFAFALKIFQKFCPNACARPRNCVASVTSENFFGGMTPDSRRVI